MFIFMNTMKRESNIVNVDKLFKTGSQLDADRGVGASMIQ